MGYTILHKNGEFIGLNPGTGYQTDLPGVVCYTTEDLLPDLNIYTWDMDSMSFVQLEYPRVITKLQFRRKFTQEERILVDQFNASFMTSTTLTDEQKATIYSGLEDYDAAQEINLDDPGTQALLGMYVAIGILSMARFTEITR